MDIFKGKLSQTATLFEEIAKKKWNYGDCELKTTHSPDCEFGEWEYTQDTTHFNYLGWLVGCEVAEACIVLKFQTAYEALGDNILEIFEERAKVNGFCTESDFAKSTDEDIIFEDGSIEQAYDGFMLAIEHYDEIAAAVIQISKQTLKV